MSPLVGLFQSEDFFAAIDITDYCANGFALISSIFFINKEGNLIGLDFPLYLSYITCLAY